MHARIDWRRAIRATMAACLGVSIGATPALAAPPDGEAHGALEAYLEARALDDVLAAHLRRRLREPGADRPRLAERLGDLYVRMLKRETRPDERRVIEAWARELLESAPEAGSFELRIDLANAEFLHAESIIEKNLILLAAPDEIAEADRVLRAIAPGFEEIATRADARVAQLEAAERRAAEDDLGEVADDLRDARRVRSLAHYYAGWAAYYTGVLDGARAGPARAAAARVHFGYVLGAAPGRPATLDQFSRSLLAFEHVGRAAIGHALATALAGDDAEAARWLRAIQEAEATPAPVREKALEREMMILARAGRWAEAEIAARRRRAAIDGASQPLPVHLARLMVVEGMRCAKDPSTKEGLRQLAERSAQNALADLVARKEVGHVLDLVSRLGTFPMGDQGFIAHYVRGLQAFEGARAAHKSGAEPPDAPTRRVELVNAYRDAARLLGLAIDSPEASSFAPELAGVHMRRGLALYYAADTAPASESFLRAFELAPSGTLKEDALWFAIVALDHGVSSGTPSLAEQRDRVAILFTRTFPASEHAARLLLRQANIEKLDDDEALKVLLQVGADSPIYEASRRQAARLLFRTYRRASAADRAYAALRFADVAEDLVRVMGVRAREPNALDAAQAVVLHARQLAEAFLSIEPPEVARARQALDALEAAAAAQRVDLASLEPELLYRRLQIALALGEAKQAEALLDRLRQSGGEFALAGDRLLYRRSHAAWSQSKDDPALAQRVVAHGLVVLRAPDPESGAFAPVRLAVAEAAHALHRAAPDERWVRVIVDQDSISARTGSRTAIVLRRLAEFAELDHQDSLALECWRDLLAGLTTGDASWFEARYHSIRLLARADRAGARAAMDQLATLYPGLGPEPWSERLRTLRADLAGPAPGAGGTP